MKSHVNNMSFHFGACCGFIFKYKKDYNLNAYVTWVTHYEQ